MASHKKFSLVLLVVFGIAFGSLSAQPSSDTVKQNQDSTRVQADSTKSEFPSSYDPKILKKIETLPPEEFAYPVGTVLRPDSKAATAGIEKAAIVWMRVLLDRDRKVRNTEVVYCSTPGEGFEKTALEATASTPIAPFDQSRKDGWFWHQVLFTGTCGRVCNDTLDIPHPDQFIACDVQPEMIKQAQPLYPESCKEKGQAGSVWVKALVSRDGFVLCALTGKSSGVSLLDEAAVASAYRNLFKPATQNGHSVAVWVSYKVQYSLGSWQRN